MSDAATVKAGLKPEAADLVSRLLETAKEAQAPLDLSWRASGFELRVAATVDTPAGRPRLFVFRIDDDKLFAFFYKPSRLSFSKDRFSYGLMPLHRGRPDDVVEAFREGLGFLVAGFKPSARPAKLGRAVNVTVPRD